MSLKEYRKKRDFTKTNEPKGKQKKEEKKNSLRFVIQYHQSRTKHYDFRLEHQGVLLSWAVPKGLSFDPKIKRLAIQVEDHPLDYISFAGKIPQGNYGAGKVEIYDQGTYIPLKRVTSGLKHGHLRIMLEGKRFQGIWSLIRKEDTKWLLIKEKDENIKKQIKNPFQKCDAMLATLTDQIPTRDYLFEIKYDGYRILSYVEGKKVKMMTRNHQDYTKKFPHIYRYFSSLNQTMVLDGEIVALDKKGRSNFSLLQTCIKENPEQVVYVLFDILALDGKDLRQEPLVKRKKILKNIMKNFPDFLLYSEHVIDHGKESFAYAFEMGLEGIIGKQIHSPYQEKRSTDWLKIKCYQRQELIILGYMTSSKNPDLSALLLGYYQDQQLVYAGKVGTGFTQTERKELQKMLRQIEVKKTPIPSNKEKNVHWVKPKKIVEVQFAEWTKQHLLRQASYLGLREDKEIKDVIFEKK